MPLGFEALKFELRSLGWFPVYLYFFNLVLSKCDLFRVVTTYNLHANKHIVVQNLSFWIMGAHFDLFMMKNTAHVLVAEGYNGGRT